MFISVPDSLRHVNSDFIGVDDSVSGSSRMRRDVMTVHDSGTAPLKDGKNSPRRRDKIVYVCVFHSFFFHLKITELQCDKLKTTRFLPEATLIALICSDNRTTGREKTRERERCPVLSVCFFSAEQFLSFFSND